MSLPDRLERCRQPPAGPIIPSGFRSRRLREAQYLPLGWSHLTGIDIAHLQSLIDDVLASRSDLRKLETCLLTLGSLLTGRPADLLLPLTYRVLKRGEPLPDGEGLIRVNGHWGWWLIAGAPRAQRRADPTRPGLRSWSSRVFLPCTRRISSLINGCLALRGGPGGLAFAQAAPAALFQYGGDLLHRVPDLLAERIPNGAAPRRATTTPEALTRWLPAAVTQMPGGDPVLAGILCGRIERVAETAAHYGSADLAHLYDLYVATVGTIGETVDMPLAPVRARYAGDRLTPTLHAFYGHGLLEDGTWNASGGLDPPAYRADLAQVLDEVLQGAGWQPRGLPMAGCTQ